MTLKVSQGHMRAMRQKRIAIPPLEVRFIEMNILKYGIKAPGYEIKCEQ